VKTSKLSARVLFVITLYAHYSRVCLCVCVCVCVCRRIGQMRVFHFGKLVSQFADGLKRNKNKNSTKRTTFSRGNVTDYIFTQTYIHVRTHTHTHTQIYYICIRTIHSLQRTKYNYDDYIANSVCVSDATCAHIIRGRVQQVFRRKPILSRESFVWSDRRVILTRPENLPPLENLVRLRTDTPNYNSSCFSRRNRDTKIDIS